MLSESRGKQTGEQRKYLFTNVEFYHSSVLFVAVVDITFAERNVTDLFSVLRPHPAQSSQPVVQVVCSYLTSQGIVFVVHFHLVQAGDEACPAMPGIKTT